MPTTYDKRRPRIPAELGQKIDAARGQVAFDAFVRRAVEAVLPGHDGAGDREAEEGRGVAQGRAEPNRASSPPAAPPRASAPKVDRVMEAHRALPKPRRADYATGEQWQDAVRVWKAQR